MPQILTERRQKEQVGDRYTIRAKSHLYNNNQPWIDTNHGVENEKEQLNYIPRLTLFPQPPISNKRREKERGREGRREKE